jgi:hypothetical protein
MHCAAIGWSSRLLLAVRFEALPDRMETGADDGQPATTRRVTRTYSTLVSCRQVHAVGLESIR